MSRKNGVEPRLEALFGPADSDGIIRFDEAQRGDRDHLVDAFRYAIDRLNRDRARYFELFGMPSLRMTIPQGSRAYLEYLIASHYPQVTDDFIVERIAPAATNKIFVTGNAAALSRLARDIAAKMPATIHVLPIRHGAIGAFLARRSKWNIAPVATTPYMDKLLERWVELSSQDDELSMRAMEQHEFGRELLVDLDRYQEEHRPTPSLYVTLNGRPLPGVFSVKWDAKWERGR